MKSMHELDAGIQESLLLERLENFISSQGWCLTELAAAAGRPRRWIQRKLRGDTPLTIREFFLIVSIIDWDLEFSEVTR